MSTTAATGDFDIGRVISLTFKAIGRNLPVFLLLSLIFAGIPAFAVSWLSLDVAKRALTGTAVGFDPNIIASAFGGGLVSLVTTYVLQGALVRGAIDDFNGRKADFGVCISNGLRYFLPLLVISILTSLGTAFGFILFIIPGFIFLVMWTVVVPAEVVEKAGIFGSFGRSRQLTKGHRWSVFALLIIYVILMGVVSAVAQGVTTPFLMSNDPGAAIGAALATAALQAVTSLFAAVGVTALYFELRRVKEGVGADQLAAVFD